MVVLGMAVLGTVVLGMVVVGTVVLGMVVLGTVGVPSTICQNFRLQYSIYLL
jgi:hypothetical protein